MAIPAESPLPSPGGPQHEPGASEASVADAPPVVAVIILSSGDLDLLDRSLDALSRQDVAACYEVLVVDDAYESATARLVASWQNRIALPAVAHPGLLATEAPPASRDGQAGRRAHARLRYLACQTVSAGAVAALNLGWRSTAATLVACTDVDTVAATDWLRQGLAGFSIDDGGAMSEGAGARNKPPDAVFGRVDSILPKHPTEVQLDIHLRDGSSFTPSNWFVRRTALERLGGFDERFADPADATTDLQCRLLADDAPVVHVDSATVAHPVGPASWGASLLELRRLSSEALLEHKHPKLYREHRHRPAPPLWHDLAVVAALSLAGVGVALRHEVLTVAAGGTWLVLTAMLCIRRLRDTARTPGHIAEVMLTSLFMPPLALFWRLVGVVRYRTRFARP